MYRDLAAEQWHLEIKYFRAKPNKKIETKKCFTLQEKQQIMFEKKSLFSHSHYEWYKYNEKFSALFQ